MQLASMTACWLCMLCILGGNPETLHLLVCMSCWACKLLALMPRCGQALHLAEWYTGLNFGNKTYTGFCVQGIYGGQAFGLKFLHTLEEPSHRENAVNEIVVGAAARGNECESPAQRQQQGF